MILPKFKLSNPYYFFNNNVLYEISNTNDKDGCGKHLVKFITEEKTVKKGDTYYDEFNNKCVAEESGTVNVATTTVDVEYCKNVFPNFYVEYQDKETGEKGTKYYWLQDMIADGDTLESGKFVINQVHENPDNAENSNPKTGINPGINPGDPTPVTGDVVDGGEQTIGGQDGTGSGTKEEYSYLSKFIDSVNSDIDSYIAKELSMDEIKEKLPYYVFAQEGDEVTINGRTVVVTNVSIPTVKDEDMLAKAYEIINKKTIEYADGLLKKYRKEVDGKEDLVWVDETKVKDIEG